MNRKMLEKGIALLVEDANNEKGIMFDFQTYGHVHDKEKPYSCSTVGCAMGLFLVKGMLGVDLDITFGDLVPVDSRGNEIHFSTLGKNVFDLSGSAYEALFTDTDGLELTVGSEGELQVARRIEWFLECDGDLNSFYEGLQVAMTTPLQRSYT